MNHRQIEPIVVLILIVVVCGVSSDPPVRYQLHLKPGFCPDGAIIASISSGANKRILSLFVADNLLFKTRQFNRNVHRLHI